MEEICSNIYVQTCVHVYFHDCSFQYAEQVSQLVQLRRVPVFQYKQCLYGGTLVGHNQFKPAEICFLD